VRVIGNAAAGVGLTVSTQGVFSKLEF